MKFKNLESSDILLSSFEVHKTFTVTNEDTGSGVYPFQITKGTDATQYGWGTDTGLKTTLSGSTFYSIPNYYVINNMFYRDVKQMYEAEPNGFNSRDEFGIQSKGVSGVYVDHTVDYISAVPTSSEAIISYTETRNLYDIQDKPSKLILRRPHTRQLRDTANVISVPQELYGEYIKIESVRLTDDSTDTTIILQDDGRGNLYDVAYSASFARRHPDSNNSGSVVGNVFYDHGIIVITDTGSYSNVGIATGSNGFSLQFDSSQTIYEREYVCSVGEGEFQNTTNRSLKIGHSGSISFSGSAYTSTVEGGQLNVLSTGSIISTNQVRVERNSKALGVNTGDTILVIDNGNEYERTVSGITTAATTVTFSVNFYDPLIYTGTDIDVQVTNRLTANKSYKNTIDDDYPYGLTGFATGSYKNKVYEIGTELIGEATHSHFATYVTTVGLYNNSNELCAVAKLSRPLIKDFTKELLVRVKLDY